MPRARAATTCAAWCGICAPTGQLTAGLILRALLSGNLELFDDALVELSGLPQARVSALVYDGGGASLDALLTRAGLPESTFPAFRAALEASQEIGFVARPTARRGCAAAWSSAC